MRGTRGNTKDESQNVRGRARGESPDKSNEGGLKERMPEIAMKILSFYPPNKHILNPVHIIHPFPCPAYYLLSVLTTMAGPLVDRAV